MKMSGRTVTEFYKVKIIRDVETGVAVEEHWRLEKSGKTHRSLYDGPAITHRDGETGEVLEEHHCIGGYMVPPELLKRPARSGKERLAAPKPR